MAEQAATAAADGYRLLKLKLTGEDDRLRVSAVRRGAPEARLIVDANESWGAIDILSEAEALAIAEIARDDRPAQALMHMLAQRAQQMRRDGFDRERFRHLNSSHPLIGFLMQGRADSAIPHQSP